MKNFPSKIKKKMIARTTFTFQRLQFTNWKHGTEAISIYLHAENRIIHTYQSNIDYAKQCFFALRLCVTDTHTQKHANKSRNSNNNRNIKQFNKKHKKKTGGGVKGTISANEKTKDKTRCLMFLIWTWAYIQSKLLWANSWDFSFCVDCRFLVGSLKGREHTYTP